MSETLTNEDIDIPLKEGEYTIITLQMYLLEQDRSILVMFEFLDLKGKRQQLRSKIGEANLHNFSQENIEIRLDILAIDFLIRLYTERNLLRIVDYLNHEKRNKVASL